MAFLRNLLAVLVGLSIFTFLGIVLLVGIIGAASSAEDIPEVKSNTVLHLNLGGVVVEKAVDDPFEEVFANGPKQISLLDLISAIDAAKNDDRIKGIYLEPQYLQAGYSSLQEIRDAILDFKSSGKFVHAYGEYISEGDYYLVSTADSIYLNPEGSLEFNGLTAGVTFFKGLFEKLDIEPQIFRVGEFKSFIEPFVRKSMSEENRLQLTELITSVHSTYLENVSEVRGIPVEILKGISDQMKVRFPEDAADLGLVSKVAYEDEMIDLLKREVGLQTSDDLTLMTYSKYMKTTSSGYSSSKVAVIVANGDIVMGSADGVIGGDQFAREIRKARENDAVKAIVLRVNSPGGSLTASDIIWREIMLTKGVKPIIASMSDVAASGGYFISMPCDTIVAQPNTITGSIGIFGMMFNIEGFLENKLGITNESVNTGEFSDIMTISRPLTEYEKAIIQSQVEDGYKTFTTKAAEGRNMDVEQLKKYAGGRVWSGTQAYERGLVDVLGSYETAVAIAAEKAGISDDFAVRYYPEQKPFLEKILDDLNEVKVSIFAPEVDVMTPYLEKIQTLERMRGIQARLPGDITIK
ncbi:MAG: signal peptide peptidase SppA [Flammeovirgaceae bacterium]|nr:signal peptide peptidase SppA [Flammeovirgaceae bacterium]|tara:strand:+ start:3895 stop:5634 length:1740 start_codon:yes stop_codon:yes gene_type:complete